MSLYHKYRPRTLAQIKGNKEVVTSLITMLEDLTTFPHAILLHGPTGCGKTSIARIIADSLGATKLDLKEVNSSDFRGIDTAREIIKNSHFRPVESPCRVWIIEEAQGLTKEAQNALLTTLEDTPKHSYFILCTTDPKKLLPTVKNRCSQFQVDPLTDPQMVGLLKKIVKEEQQTLEQEIYDSILPKSQGHPRTAIQILEQVLNVPEQQRLEMARRSVEREAEVIELCRALIKKKSWKTVSGLLVGLRDQDAEGVRRAVLGYCQVVLLRGADEPRAGLIMEEMIEPFYNTGFPGLTYACYSITKN